jgi:hypothetical protein
VSYYSCFWNCVSNFIKQLLLVVTSDHYWMNGCFFCICACGHHLSGSIILCCYFDSFWESDVSYRNPCNLILILHRTLTLSQL